MKGAQLMRKVVLYIAMSLDGYIADNQGGVAWLNGQGNDTENMDTYSEFVKDIDTILMGRNTYNQIVTELSPTEWPYRDFTTYVFTHNKSKSTEKIEFTDENPVKLLKALKACNGKDIWICGGADLIGQLRRSDLIDKYIVTIIPTLLGKGIRLFGEIEKEQKLFLTKTQKYNGMVELIYERRIVFHTFEKRERN